MGCRSQSNEILRESAILYPARADLHAISGHNVACPSPAQIGTGNSLAETAVQGMRQLAPVLRFQPWGDALSARAVRACAILATVALLPGCILKQDLPDPAFDIPAAYQKDATPRKQDAPPSLDWWRGFRSQELTVLMEETQQVNLDIAAATARILQADALARTAGAALLPTLDANASATRSKSSSGFLNNGTAAARGTINTYSTSLSASYEIDLWGKNRDALLAAEKTADANRFDRDTVVLTSLASVANAYFQVLAAQDRIATAHRNIASAQRIYDAIKARVNAGTSSDLDLAQQESLLANQRAAVPPLRQTLTQNINILATLVARPPERIRVKGGSLSRISAPRITPGLPSELLIQRPDIRRQEAQLASATANVGSARAQFFPSIQLTGQGGYQSAALSALFMPQSAFFNLAAGLTQPIFDAGRIQANFDLTKAQQDELLQTYRKTVISAFSDVDTALDAVKQTADRLRLQRIVVASSRRAFELSEKQLQAGTADIVTVLNTQQTLFQAEDTLQQVQLAWLQSYVSLFSALGGGWEPQTVLTTTGPTNAL
ncbi:Outer membrane protein oprM precursor [Afipia felis]|uniref:Outer membrane protein oprM n=3 Tax=Afipia felis TaxID=1035 RepID=A0A380W8A3_AFIFE|nr:NodT family efflux transporter, outer membrane factor (OMF) lipoprotein [Afipia felis ATCC 53690]SUU77029.1 Outer membrane protein oprM precursor [Afipia felis]SUU85096.1 Outer membrane protein oprM precursor [Afipia felis]